MIGTILKDYTSKKVVLYFTGGVPNAIQELDVMRKTLHDVKPNKTIKFNTKMKNENDKIAYELGKKLSKKD